MENREGKKKKDKNEKGEREIKIRGYLKKWIWMRGDEKGERERKISRRINISNYIFK